MRLPWQHSGGEAGGRRRSPWSGADFVSLLLAQVRELEGGLEEWTQYLADRDPARLDRIEAIEEEGDRARLAVVGALDRQFITPLDREDIYTLARAIDDVLDAVEMAMLECGHGVPEYGAVPAVVGVGSAAAVHLGTAVRALLTAPESVRDESIELHRAAKRIDRAARDALHAMGDGDDLEQLRRLVRAREVNHYLRAIGERLDLLADVLAEIVVKGA